MSSEVDIQNLDVAIAVVHRRGSILICQRPTGGTFAGLWEFPGGKCEPGESIPDCLHRELREELGIAVRIERPLTTVAHRYPKAHLRLHPFLCALGEAQPQPLQCCALRWIQPAHLRDYMFPPANDPLLSEIQRTFGDLP